MARPARTTLLVLLVTALLLGATGLALADKGRGSDARAAAESMRECQEKARQQGDDDGDDDDDGKRGEGKSARGKAAKECAEKLAKKAKLEKRGDKWLVKNDDISVWFHTSKHGEKAKPHLKVFWTGEDGNKTGYSVKVLRLFEIETDGAAKYLGTHNSINLERADDWNVQHEQVGSDITLRMTRAEAQGIVTLVWHLNATSKEIKFDLLVDNWRWGAENASTHRLALDILVEGKNLQPRDDASATLDGGYVTWERRADATYADGRTGNLTVGSSTYGEEDGKYHLVLVFNGEGGYKNLVYDPSFGVMSAQTEGVKSSIPAPGLVGAVLAVAAVAALAGARRRRDA